MANKKVVSVLSTAAIGTLIATAVGSTVFAAVDGLVVKNAAGSYLNYDLDALKASVVNDALGQAGAELYKDFDAARTAGSIVSYHDNKVGFVDAAAVQKAALDAALAGTSFKLDTFTESSKEAVLPATVYQATVTNGKVVAGAEVKPTSATTQEVAVTAVGAKKLEVKFTQAVDTTKVALTVKKGTIPVNISKTTFADDKKSAVLELSGKLTAGDYTVSVTGITDTAITKTATVADEKIAKIDVLSDIAVISAVNADEATVSYKVYNQYNENITAASTVTLTTTAADQVNTTITPATGIIKLDNNATAYKAGDKVTVSLLDSATGTFTSKVVTVADKAQTSTIGITGLYQVDSKVLSGDTLTGDVPSFKLILDAKDQYGNNIVPTTNDVVVTTSDATVMDIDVADITTQVIDGVTKTVLPLTAPGSMKAGKATITIISKTTGAVAKYDVVVKDGVKADVFAVSLPDLIVANETTKVPFTVADTNGNDITSAAKLNTAGTGITFTAPTGIALSFTQNYVTNKPELNITVDGVGDANPVTAGKYTIVATTANAKTISFVVDVKADAVPTSIVGLDSTLATNIVVGQNLTIGEDKVIVNDQYGRVIGLDTLLGTTSGKYNLVVTEPTVSGKVTLTTNTADADNDDLVVSGDVKGSTTLQLKLQKHNGTSFVDVAGSEYSFNSSVVQKADIVSYELADIANLYDDNAGNDTTSVVVYGVLANGTKVVVPSSWLTVSSSNSNISVSGTTLDTTAANVTGTTKADVTAPVEVIVDAANAPVFLTKNVVVTAAAPVVAKTVVNTSVVNGAVTFTAANVNATTFAAALQGLFTFTDQYGNTINNNTATITFTSLVNSDASTAAGTVIAVSANNGTTTADIDNAQAGDTLNVTVKAAGYSNTIKVVVTP